MTAGKLRQEVYKKLMKERVLAYPYPPFGHHPNFIGAAKAAKNFLEYSLKARLLKPGDTAYAFPDYVLRPLRRDLLETGIHVIVPAKYGNGFRLLDANKVNPKKAASIAGAEKEGELIKAPSSVKLCVIACVALTKDGKVLSKGYGPKIPDALEDHFHATLVHPLQIVDKFTGDSSGVELFATPEKVSNLSAKR